MCNSSKENASKRISDQFSSALDKSEVAARARFDALLKDDSANSPQLTLADIVYELIQMNKEIAELRKDVDGDDDCDCGCGRY